MHIDSNVSNLRFKRLSKSQPRVENSRSHVAEFGHIENKWQAIFGSNSGSGSVATWFHHLIGFFLAKARSTSNGSFFSWYFCIWSSNISISSRSKLSFFPIDSIHFIALLVEIF